MKNLIFSFVAVFSFGLCISSCGNKAKSGTADAEKSEVVDKTGKEYTSAYVCPMHCQGSGSDKAGICPVCKMDYVVNKDYKNSDGQDDHEGHDHEDHDGHDHGNKDNHDGHDHGDHDGHDH